MTADQTAFVRQAIKADRLHRPEEAVREALSLVEERERRRAETLVAVAAAKVSLAAGKGRIMTEGSMRQLSSEVSGAGGPASPLISRRSLNGAPRRRGIRCRTG